MCQLAFLPHGCECIQDRQLRVCIISFLLATGGCGNLIGFAGHCYKYNPQHLTYTDAMTYCQTLDATLVEIGNQAEQDFVEGTLEGSSIINEGGHITLVMVA